MKPINKIGYVLMASNQEIRTQIVTLLNKISEINKQIEDTSNECYCAATGEDGYKEGKDVDRYSKELLELTPLNKPNIEQILTLLNSMQLDDTKTNPATMSLIDKVIIDFDKNVKSIESLIDIRKDLSKALKEKRLDDLLDDADKCNYKFKKKIKNMVSINNSLVSHLAILKNNDCNNLSNIISKTRFYDDEEYSCDNNLLDDILDVASEDDYNYEEDMKNKWLEVKKSKWFKDLVNEDSDEETDCEVEDDEKDDED